MGELRGYKKVFVYKSINDSKLIYVSKSLHILDRFFLSRFNSDKSGFTYEGEMMVRLNCKKYYIQIYHGVYKRIYNKETVKSERVKLKKVWSNDNFKGMNARKLQKVIVGWKHSEKIETDDGISIRIKFPKITYEDNDLKGRTYWSNIKWLRQAVIDYIENTGYDPKNIEDTTVNKIY